MFHQNRNRVLSSALSDLAVKLQIIIEQLYLEKGPTMMDRKVFQASDEYQILPQRKPLPDLSNPPEPLYKTRLPIAESKYLHLQELKSVIEKDYHTFYDNIPFKKKNAQSRSRKG